MNGIHIMKMDFVNEDVLTFDVFELVLNMDIIKLNLFYLFFCSFVFLAEGKVTCRRLTYWRLLKKSTGMR